MPRGCAYLGVPCGACAATSTAERVGRMLARTREGVNLVRSVVRSSWPPPAL